MTSDPPPTMATTVLHHVMVQLTHYTLIPQRGGGTSYTHPPHPPYAIPLSTRHPLTYPLHHTLTLTLHITPSPLTLYIQPFQVEGSVFAHLCLSSNLSSHIAQRQGGGEVETKLTTEGGGWKREG